MMHTADELVAELARVDAELAKMPAGEFTGLDTILAARAGLLERLIPMVAASAEDRHRQALERSLSAGMCALRQIIQTRYLITKELDELGRAQQFAGRLAALAAPLRHSTLSVEG